jgi:hypothetical protein
VSDCTHVHCPRCGYTPRDQAINMDHRLCSGMIPAPCEECLKREAFEVESATCPCPGCGADLNESACDCRIMRETFKEDVCSDDQGTVWRDAEIDWCHTHRCEVESARRAEGEPGA